MGVYHTSKRNFFAVFEEVENDGDDGTEDDEENDGFVVRVNPGNIPQKVTQGGDANSPE